MMFLTTSTYMLWAKEKSMAARQSRMGFGNGLEASFASAYRIPAAVSWSAWSARTSARAFASTEAGSPDAGAAAGSAAWTEAMRPSRTINQGDFFMARIVAEP